jgi:hypothetical protein
MEQHAFQLLLIIEGAVEKVLIYCAPEVNSQQKYLFYWTKMYFSNLRKDKAKRKIFIRENHFDSFNFVLFIFSGLRVN